MIKDIKNDEDLVSLVDELKYRMKCNLPLSKMRSDFNQLLNGFIDEWNLHDGDNFAKLKEGKNKIQIVISGGQTGADEGGLLAAVDCGIATGGWLPNGCVTEDGPRPDMLEKYGMIEYSGGYAPRTAVNVRNSDGTIRIAYNLSSAGERCTMKAIRKYGKPHIDVDVTSPRPHEEVVRWIEENNIEVLNVAGNRESTFPGMSKFVQEYLGKVFMDIQ